MDEEMGVIENNEMRDLRDPPTKEEVIGVK